MAIKRLNYFDHQFLVVDDFKDEQKYHRDMRQRLTRGLHTFGIAEGLAVLKTGNRQVTVQPGVAIDRDGQEIVLEASHPGRVLDLTNVGTFPPGSTVHVTVAYNETPINPLTDNRATEEPKLEAKTTAPPGDGTVVRLAQFNLAPDVPGSLNDPLDGGARQPAGARLGPAAVAESNLAPALLVKVNNPQGVVSLDGVSNPGGNVDLVASPGITITPNNAAKTITIGQNVTAAQIGAMMQADYEFEKRGFQTIQFSQLDANGAVKAVPLGFQPRFVLAISNCSADLGAPSQRRYGGPGVGFFESISNQQRCCGIAVTRLTATDWFTNPIPLFVGICGARFFDQTVVPTQIEHIVVTVTPTATGLNASLNRTILGAALTTFDLSINLFCMGP
jgi:hypothetical protein